MRVASMLLALTIAAPLSAWAAPSTCPENLAGGVAPDLLNAKMVVGTRELCYPGFVALHSAKTRTALWSAEHLTRDRIESARGVHRTDMFHADQNLPPDERAELSDYARSGYDRGHMSPSGDAPDETSQAATFTLGNMIPQDPNNNRNLWEGVEAATRNLAVSDGEVYVVTGPIFAGGPLQALKGRVLVPTQIFKAVYDTRTGQAGAYLVNNAPGMAWQQITIAQLRELDSIDPFPALSEQVKQAGMALPLPTPHGKRGGIPATTLLAAAAPGQTAVSAGEGGTRVGGAAESFARSVGVSMVAKSVLHTLMSGWHHHY